MAGERFALLGSPNSYSIPEGTQLPMRVSDGARRKETNEEAGWAGRGGKLRLSRPLFFRKKPYDRPLPPGTLDRPLSTGRHGPTPSLPARLVDSASNLITSSASYLFESFFNRRRALWIGNGIQPTAVAHSEDPMKEDVSPLQGPAPAAHPEKVEGEDLDLAQVEEVLKQQFLSREEVKRLSYALRIRARGRIAVGSTAEAHRWQRKKKQVGRELDPVELAKAYMGKRTPYCGSTTPHWQNTLYQYGEVAGPSSGSIIQDDAYEGSFAYASRANPAAGTASARMLKRRLIADDEDSVILRGPTRRVRQKMTIMANTSPYIRQVTAATGPLRTPSTPLSRPSEWTEKIMDALEQPMLPFKGKSVEELLIVEPCHNEDLPESSKVRESMENYRNEEFLALPASGELGISSCKPADMPVATTALKTVQKSVIGSLAASTSESPKRTKGFHMSAFFEDSSSDEEAGPSVKAPTSSEAQLAGRLISKVAPQTTTRKHPCAFISNDDGPCSTADSTKISSPMLLQPSVAAGPSNSKANSFPTASSSPTHLSDSPPTVAFIGKSTPLLSNVKPIPVVSHVLSAVEKVSPLLTVSSASATAPLFVALSMSPISASPSIPTPLPATAPAVVSLPVLKAATVAVAPVSSAVVVEPISVMPKVAAAEGSVAETSGAFTAFQPPFRPPVSATRVAEAASNAAPSFTTLAAASKLQAALVTSATSVSPVGSVADAGPVVVEGGMGGAQPDNATATGSFLKAGISSTSASESPGTDRQAEQDTMATDPMTEEPDSSIACSSAPAFLFGSASIVTSTSLGQTPPFGSSAASSPFLFPMQSSTPSRVSSSVQFPLSSHSSSAAGQLFAFGASGSAPANPFLATVKPSFTFGSSAATSASSMFTATSSAPITFPATPAAPYSFPFGAHAASSSLTSSTSVFGAQSIPTASAFAGTGAQTNAFVFPPTPPSSGAPTPPSFQFGGAGADTSSIPSGPSFGGQSFIFGGQPTVSASNPFAQSRASNVAPFQFASSAATSSQSVFSSGANAASTFSFGAQPTASPFPFTFGGQAGALPTGQPFGFGGQPAAPAQSSFTSSGATGQSPLASAGASGMDFAGGFSLGAAGGEKSGRKFIKAKRIGGSKRGK